MKSHRLAVLLVALIFFTSAGCDKADHEDTAETADTTAVGETSPVLTEREWLQRGMPAASGIWTGVELEQAFNAIKEANDEGLDLPRHKAEGSQFFKQFLTAKKADFFDADSMGFDVKLQQGSNTLLAITKIYMLYLNEARMNRTYTDEVIELIITLMDVQEELMHIARNFTATLTPEQRSMEQFQQGMAQMQRGTTQSVSGVIRLLRDTTIFTEPQLEYLANSFRRSGRELITHLDEEYRDSLEQEAQVTIDDVDNRIIDAALESLFPLTK